MFVFGHVSNVATLRAPVIALENPSSTSAGLKVTPAHYSGRRKELTKATRELAESGQAQGSLREVSRSA
jgi:hypothetical protein